MKATTAPADANVHQDSTNVSILKTNKEVSAKGDSIVNVLKENKSDTKTPTLASVKAATDRSSQILQSINLSVHYSVDKSTNEMVIKVVDNSGKLVRQIPSTEMLDFIKRLQEMEDKQKGTVIQTSA